MKDPIRTIEVYSDATASPECTFALRELRADAQALADVRTLDEWAAADDERYVVAGPQYFGKSWYCTLWHVENKREAGPFQGPTPDAARHAAAEWVRGQVKP